MAMIFWLMVSATALCSSEALAICTLGGLIGVAVGLGTTWLFAWFGRPVVFSPEPVLLAFSCAFGRGMDYYTGFVFELRDAGSDEPVDRLAIDFIAGMTDRYAMNLYSELFLPRPWN